MKLVFVRLRVDDERAVRPAVPDAGGGVLDFDAKSAVAVTRQRAQLIVAEPEDEARGGAEARLEGGPRSIKAEAAVGLLQEDARIWSTSRR